MNLRELKNRVKEESIKVVSFDIFDTLLLRPCIEPADIFRLVAKRCGLPVEFVSVRRKAEEIARTKRPYYDDDITFENIYDEFISSFGYSEEEVRKIKQTELDIELEYLKPRYSLQGVFEEAVKSGKTIVICSDMYHSAEFLTKVLNKNNYKGFKLYVSSEYKLSKGSKRLFKKIINDFSKEGIKANQILHIGDNYRADIENSKSVGMQAEYVESVKNKIKRIRSLSTLHGYMTLTSNLNSDNTFLIGYAANMIFDDPYREFDYASRFNGELETLSNLLLAPLTFSFVKWMLEDSIKRGVDKLCLIYRDGYLPEEIIKILQPYYSKTPELTRLRLSRRALRCFESKKNHGFIIDAIYNPVNAKMKLTEYLDLRVFITDKSQKNEIFDKIKYLGYMSLDDEIGSSENQIELAKAIEKYFNDNSCKSINIIKEYCDKELGKYNSLAIFDIGYSGRIHKVLKNHFDIKNICYHIFGYNYLKSQENDVNSFQDISSSFTNKALMIHNAFFEDIISEQKPSVSRIIKENGNVEFIFDEEFSENKNILKLQEYILNFISSFTKNFADDLLTMNFEGFDFYEVYKNFINNPNIKDAKIFLNFEFQDNWITGNKFSYYENWYNSKFRHLMTDTTVNNKIKNKIKKVLKIMHLFDFSKKVYLRLKKIQSAKYQRRMKISRFENNMDTSIKEINSISLQNTNSNILVLGQIASFDKGTCNYFNNLNRKMDEYNFVLISETPAMNIEQINKKINFKALNLPVASYPGKFDKFLEVPVSKEIDDKLYEKKYLKHTVNHLKNQFIDMTESYAKQLAVYFYNYCCEVLDKVKPKKVIIWNQFSAMHEVMKNVCDEKEIPVIFMEFGVLPGTFAFDNNGQMGESTVCVNYEEFNTKDVSKEEINNAREIITFIRDSKLNRNIQPMDDVIDKIKEEIDRSRPTIVLFGQSDYESGISPYTEHTKKFHSPIVKSSNESMTIMAEIARKNNYNLIYKPHPAMKYLNLKSKIPSNVIVVDEVNLHDLIDISDVVVTVVSQTSYEALIRNTPVLMLGYNQLKGKGCTYEAFEYEHIESKLKDAIENGFTKEQKLSFDKHVAQLLRYYLFDDIVKKDMKIGQSIDGFYNYFNNNDVN